MAKVFGRAQRRTLGENRNNADPGWVSRSGQEMYNGSRIPFQVYSCDRQPLHKKLILANSRCPWL